jgi:Tol biopolymer transport system component
VLDVGYYTQDLAYRIEPGRGTTTLSRVADGSSWTVPAGGQSVSISPGRSRIGWTDSNPDVPFQRRVSQVMVADLDGGNARSIATVLRGGFSGWLTDDRLLYSERLSRESGLTVLSVYDLSTGQAREVVRADRMRGTLVSPSGRWMVYHVAVTGDPSQHGFFLVDLENGGSRRLPNELLGAYQWRDGDRLVVVPFRPEAQWHELRELDVATGEERLLVDPATTQIKIANADWVVSPDGRRIAWVDVRDRSIWVLDLPG